MGNTNSNVYQNNNPIQGTRSRWLHPSTLLSETNQNTPEQILFIGKKIYDKFMIGISKAIEISNNTNLRSSENILSVANEYKIKAENLRIEIVILENMQKTDETQENIKKNMDKLMNLNDIIYNANIRLSKFISLGMQEEEAYRCINDCNARALQQEQEEDVCENENDAKYQNQYINDIYITDNQRVKFIINLPVDVEEKFKEIKSLNNMWLSQNEIRLKQKLMIQGFMSESNSRGYRNRDTLYWAKMLSIMMMEDQEWEYARNILKPLHHALYKNLKFLDLILDQDVKRYWERDLKDVVEFLTICNQFIKIQEVEKMLTSSKLKLTLNLNRLLDN